MTRAFTGAHSVAGAGSSRRGGFARRFFRVGRCPPRSGLGAGGGVGGRLRVACRPWAFGAAAQRRCERRGFRRRGLRLTPDRPCEWPLVDLAGAAGWPSRNHTSITSRSLSIRASGCARTCASGCTASRCTSATARPDSPAGNTPPRPEVISRSPRLTSAFAGQIGQCECARRRPRRRRSCAGRCARSARARRARGP